MKKMWKLNNKAVSPVIATILMVAITVVLAAVLYVMVMGFGGGGSDETPTASLTYTNTAEGYRVTIQSISQNDVLIGDVTWLVDGAAPVAPVLVDTVWAAGTGADTEPVVAGSYIVLDLDGGASYTITLLYNPTNNNAGTVTINVP